MAQKNARFHKDTSRDVRSDFQRDRDRILYTPELRRLAGITQVSAATSKFLVHNRLTHVLEVAQIGLRLAEKLKNDHHQLSRLDPNVVEAACLAHDLGHPPFGHVAEKELQTCCESVKLRDSFEGNAQTFRILTKLAVKSKKYPGLNLTRATLDAVSKYPWQKSKKGKAAKKWGTYDSELPEFRWVRKGKLNSEAQCIEANIMDVADDIAYSVHDVIDYFKVGKIPLDQLGRDTAASRRFSARLTAVRTGLAQKELKKAHQHFTSKFYRFFIPFAEPFSGSKEDTAASYECSSQLIGRYINAAEYDPIEARVILKEQQRWEICLLKQLIWEFVILEPSLALKQAGQKQVISKLFHFFYEALSNNHTYLIPAWCHKYAEDKPPRNAKGYCARGACDIVASLSEEQALEVYAEICGLRKVPEITGLY